jgi:hypothetical protein
MQWQEAKAVIDKILLAARNAAFYPQDHTLSQKSITDCHDYLKNYTDKYGAFALEVTKTSLLFQGEPIYQNSELQNNLAYLWYRDGIKWISFSEGISHPDISSFLAILKNHRMIEEEGKGDIVTSLWEAGLSRIKYITSDVIWKDEPLLALEEISLVGKTEKTQSQGKQETEANGEEAAESIITRKRRNGNIIALTETEVAETRKLVQVEESRNFDLDVFDVLLVILQEQRESEDFETVLEIMRQSFKRAVKEGEFACAARFLARLKETHAAYRSSGTWAVAYLEDFLLMISSPQVLSGLKTSLSRIAADDRKRIAELEEMLLQLRPESITTLVRLLAAVKDPYLFEKLLHTSIRQAQADPRPLIRMANEDTKPVRRSAVYIMGRLHDPAILSHILEAARTEDADLRKTALAALTRKNPPAYETILPFLNDPDKEISQSAYSFLVDAPGKKRPSPAEAILDYMGRIPPEAGNRDFLLLLYEVLGRATKGDSPPAYLSYQLLSRPLQIGKHRQTHRLGAALALFFSGSPQAEKTLIKARKSVWPAQRRAARNAEELFHARAAQGY